MISVTAQKKNKCSEKLQKIKFKYDAKTHWALCNREYENKTVKPPLEGNCQQNDSFRENEIANDLRKNLVNKTLNASIPYEYFMSKSNLILLLKPKRCCGKLQLGELGYNVLMSQ